ncbi:MAG: pyridoxal-dependent decarboxylase, exosortase A system-associated [Gammaproteobacteria bacterium]|nr:MAG: pyridoxal-dependent decarboxylase, exosortase A system-associated [Gammaproteobacteria bacterium]
MSTPKPQHAPMEQFPVAGNELLVGGRPISEVVEQAGGTPCYLYDSAVMTARVAALRAALPRGIHLHYAMKANPMPAVVNHLAALVDGLDVASAGELEVALASGTRPGDISFAGPGKRDSELEAAVMAGIIVNLESEGELERITAIGERLGRTPVVSVRVNPAFELKASGMKMGGGPKQFGVDEERVPEMLREIAARGLDWRGLHIFSGSQNLRPEAIVEAQEQTFELALRLAADAQAPLRWLNIGGGFGIPYFPGEAWLDLAPIGENLERLLPRVREALPEAEVVIELGRYLVGPAGLYVCRVIDRKVSRGEVFLVTDGGLHHHLAASGNFGQVIRKNYPVAIANRMDSTETEPVSIVGPLCTPLDLLASRMELPRAEIGDLVAIYQSGAYGLTASPRAFLSHPDAGEMMV